MSRRTEIADDRTSGMNADPHPNGIQPGGTAAGAAPVRVTLEERASPRGDRITVLDDFNDYYDPALKRANIRGFAWNPRVTVVEEMPASSNRLSC